MLKSTKHPTTNCVWICYNLFKVVFGVFFRPCSQLSSPLLQECVPDHHSLRHGSLAHERRSVECSQSEICWMKSERTFCWNSIQLFNVASSIFPENFHCHFPRCLMSRSPTSHFEKTCNGGTVEVAGVCLTSWFSKFWVQKRNKLQIVRCTSLYTNWSWTFHPPSSAAQVTQRDPARQWKFVLKINGAIDVVSGAVSPHDLFPTTWSVKLPLDSRWKFSFCLIRFFAVRVVFQMNPFFEI